MAKKPTEGRRKLVEFDASNLSAHHCARCEARQFIGDGAIGLTLACQGTVTVGTSGDAKPEPISMGIVHRFEIGDFF